MSVLTQTIIYGLVTGGIYTLMALGFTLIYGILEKINFAHGEFYMLGAYVAYICVTTLGLPYWVAVVVAVLLVATLGVIVERLAFRPLRSSLQLNTLVSSLAIAIILQNIATLVFGAQPTGFNTPFSQHLINLGVTTINLQRIIIVFTSLLLIILLHLFIRHTDFGKMLRASAQNLTAVWLMGIDVNRVIVLAFALGAALAAVAGALIGPVFLMDPFIGTQALLKAFVVVVLGGFGNIAGTIMAGLALGIVEGLTATYISNAMVDTISFLVMIVVLLVRPSGLAGSHQVQET